MFNFIYIIISKSKHIFLTLKRLQAIILLCIFNVTEIFATAPSPWQMGFQKASSPLMVEIEKFHNFLLIIIFSISLFIIGLVSYTCYKFYHTRNKIPSKFSDNLTLETIWTIIPVIILIIISIPSFRLLRLAENAPPSDFTVKVIGNQWYWTYSYPDHGGFSFDSYMIQDNQIKKNQYRLLEVDNKIYIPKDSVVKFIITASDVIHSFALPALGIKTDAIPGKINETWTKVENTGTYYGQCSELCGINHGFMPIVLEVVEKETFNHWIENSRKNFS
ncbi:MAG: cytochrome c oxidase subunit II [Rickettsia sp.]|nr:cytochrome c oxidase subunit II [Rickettsia sp.]